MSRSPASTPRGRHAPPLAVRQDRQRQRLFAAAAAVFSRAGYADATAEAIAREAGMSKATFYEHFDNKEDCIVALFETAVGVVNATMRAAGEDGTGGLRDRVHVTVHAFLQALVDHPEVAQTLLVEIVGAGPRAMAHRDAALEGVADAVDGFNRDDVERGVAERFRSPHDAFAIVGAAVELASRQIRTGRPEAIQDLEPVVERLVLGLVGGA